MTSAEVRKGGARKADPRERRAQKSSARRSAADSTTPTSQATPAPRPNFWHRGHPVFTPLAGFFTGMAFVLVVPTTFAAVLRFFLNDDSAGDAYWLVLSTFLVPLGLVIARPTRRFGKYMWLGVGLTAVVVISVAALVVWLLARKG